MLSIFLFILNKVFLRVQVAICTQKLNVQRGNEMHGVHKNHNVNNGERAVNNQSSEYWLKMVVLSQVHESSYSKTISIVLCGLKDLIKLCYLRIVLVLCKGWTKQIKIYSKLKRGGDP